MVFATSPCEPAAADGVVVWPWRVVDEALPRSTPSAGSKTRLVVSYLVLSDSLDALDADPNAVEWMKVNWDVDPIAPAWFTDTSPRPAREPWT